MQDRARHELPSGTVTVLFTDIEDSTPLFHALGDRMLEVIDQHNALIRSAFEPYGGVEVKTEGDALFVVFADAAAAITACLDAQRALLAHPWPDGRQVRVRMGLHRGPVTIVGRDYMGVAVAEAARVSAAAHGAQVLVSEDVASAVDGALPDGVSLADLGPHLLKGFPEPRRLFELRHADLPAGFPPPRTLSATAHNLPAFPTPLVGRVEDLELLRGLLMGDARIVTLTGPGGIGKTRLAMEAARAMLAYVRGGAWFVDLAPVTAPADVIPVIARAAGVAEVPGTPLRDSLIARLAAEPVLLVLDNFEQVIDAAVVIADLLAAAETAKVLVTSRERLRIRGEHEVPVEPLRCPTGARTPEDVESTPAGRLFVDRARAADPRFVVDAAVAAAIASVCDRCHGIPLALELAAARVREMDLGDLAAELGRSNELLSEGDRDLPPRHQALAATIAWSYDALDEDARRLFRTVSIFSGGAPREAVEQLAGGGSAPTLEVLAARSLARLTADRVTMLEPIRRFGLERLTEAGERAHAERAHAAWFADLARRADTGITGAEQTRWLRVLDREIDNARSALISANVEQAERLAMAASLGRFWEIRGYWTEGRAWLAGLLAADGAEPLARGRALLAAGALAVGQADTEQAATYLEEALDIAMAQADALLEGHVRNQRGALARGRRDLDEAMRELRGAMEAMRSSGDARGILLSSVNLAAIHYDRGEFDEARALFEEAQERGRALGDRKLAARASQNLGMIAVQQGDPARARELLGDALAANRANGDQAGVAGTLTNLGVVAYKTGDRAGAADAWEEALHEARAMGNVPMVGQLLANLVAISDGDGAGALARAAEAADLLPDLGKTDLACRLLTMAARYGFAQRPDEARAALARAESLARASGDPAVLDETMAAIGEASAEAGLSPDTPEA